jgi:uncharacterized protein (TIGR00255 family)
MRSMTGFGQARAEDDRHRITIQLRSVNGRFLDLKTRLRDESRNLEPEIRERLTEALSRGRVDIHVEIRSLFERRVKVQVHKQVVRKIRRAIESLSHEGLVSSDLSPSDLLRLPDAFELQPVEESWRQSDDALLHRVLGEALEELVDARSIEGGKLASLLEEQLVQLEARVGELAQQTAGAQTEAAAALERRLAELLGDRQLDEARLAQEVAVLADRGDVREELDRLTAHISHFRQVAAKRGSIGKRLDFLTQEIFRELNTLGAKSRNATVTRTLVEAKNLAEQIREQVQNVE